MAVLKVLEYPDSRLKISSIKVANLNHEIKQLILDLVDTMIMSSHSVGIAAPQVGCNSQIIIADASRAKRECSNHGLLVLINPVIVAHSGLISSREGCMSVPDYTGNVTRAEKVTINYLDQNFTQKTITAEGFESILLQHEIDHLSGILFIDKVISTRTDLFRRKKR